VIRPVHDGGPLAATGRPAGRRAPGLPAVAIVLVVITSPLFLRAAGRESTVAFRIIVNAASPARSLTRAEISRLFLKKIEWPSHRPVLPVDLPEDSPVRKSFSQSVVGREINSLNSYWQFMIFSGRATPPVSVQSDEEVMKYVRQHAAAIGYISASTPLEPGVLEITIGEDRHR
jgi:hypothetical protein